MHALKQINNKDNVEGLIQVDAEKGFNEVNWMIMLLNIRTKCPCLSTLVKNVFG